MGPSAAGSKDILVPPGGRTQLDWVHSRLNPKLFWVLPEQDPTRLGLAEQDPSLMGLAAGGPCRTSKSARRPLAIFLLLLVFCLVLWSRHLVLWSLGTYGLRESE